MAVYAIKQERRPHKKEVPMGELRRIAVKWCGLLQEKPAFNHWRQSSPEEHGQTHHAMERNKVKCMGLHKQGLHCSRDTLQLPLSPINYQRWLITWLITALNCLCSHGSTAIFTGKLRTQWKVWQSWWSMVFVLLESVCVRWAWAGSSERAIRERLPGCTNPVTQSSPKCSQTILFMEKSNGNKRQHYKKHQSLDGGPETDAVSSVWCSRTKNTNQTCRLQFL